MQIQISETNGILQDQPCVESQTKEQNSIESTQDLRSDITKADSVIIESENYHQTACTSKDQGRKPKLINLLKCVQILSYYIPLPN